MRYTACDCDMVLMKAAPAGTEALPGFEYHSFKCAKCREVEQRLVFIRHGREVEADAIPAHDAPSIVPTAAVEESRPDPFAVITRVIDRIRRIKPATPAPETKADVPGAARE
jgi:hypothetical protein